MSAFLYGIGLQFRMDIRSRSLLVTCYLVPLMFFAVMGGIFTSLMPEAKETLTASMTVMGVSMGALIGVPPSLVEIYGTEVKKMYHAGGAPQCFGLAALIFSSFVHLMIMSGILLLAAPVMFDARIPSNIPVYLVKLAFFLVVSLALACVLGLSEESGEADHAMPGGLSAVDPVVRYHVSGRTIAGLFGAGRKNLSGLLGIPSAGRDGKLE